ncbi:unnamed protein product [Amaranthus hypochondriacus]
MEDVPYPPKHLHLQDFTPNFENASTIIASIAIVAAIIFSITWIFFGLFSKTTKVEKLIMWWLTFYGLLHMTLELYLIFTPHFYKDKTGFIFAEFWKEYSKGDFRFLQIDSTILTLEGISVFILGPTNLLVVFAIATRKSYKHVLQLMLSIGELYVVVIYTMTAFLKGEHFCASPLYFYAYFIGANSPLALIPFLLIIRSWKKISQFEDTT